MGGDSTATDRDLVYWALSSLMVAEERITTKFSGLVGAHGTRGGGDLPRHPAGRRGAPHAVLRALPGRGRSPIPPTIAEHVARAREQRLATPSARSSTRRSSRPTNGWSPRPRDLAAKVRFVTIYHLVLEGTLGLTAFHFITDYLEREGLLPGFVEGYSKIHHDEPRHIGYGVWFLRETVREHPEQGDTVRDTLRELLPSVAESLKPPGAATPTCSA